MPGQPYGVPGTSPLPLPDGPAFGQASPEKSPTTPLTNVIDTLISPRMKRKKASLSRRLAFAPKARAFPGLKFS